ncbi:MAG: branched-chain amino acid ABC transporter permease [Pseudomonadota bacterium]
MDPVLYGYMLYGISLLTVGGMYAILTLGLNVQWGFTGLFNAGIAGFFGIGAYTAAILTTSPHTSHVGGFQMPYVVAAIAAMLVAGIIAFLVGKVCLKLRSDYLAIATIGIAEIFRLIVNNETWATNGPRGISQIPRPFEGLPEPLNQFAFLGVVLVTLAGVYWLMEIARKSPWGRVMTAIRDNETSAKAAGKNVETFRMEGFVIGCMIMALAGALMAHYLKFVNPQTTDPLLATFIVFVMLVIGGSANNKGAILGAFLVWTLWSASEIVAPRLLEAIGMADAGIRSAYVRIFLIGLLLQIFLQKNPQGLLPETRPSSPGKNEP